MIERIGTFALLLVGAIATVAQAQELEQAADSADESAATEDPAVEASVPVTSGADPEQPRAMSGMSILGNEEAPKALVIIPWKSSELGDELGMPESPDDEPTAVDRDVFLRELRFYEIRKGER